MSGTASCMQVKVPVRFTARMRSHFSGVMSATASNDSMPALVTRMVIGPSFRRTSEKHPFELSTVGDVDLVADRCASLAGQLLGRLRRARTVTVEQGHGDAVRRQPVGDAEADARRRPGHHGHAAAHCATSAGVNSMCSLCRPRRTQVGS